MVRSDLQALMSGDVDAQIKGVAIQGVSIPDNLPDPVEEGYRSLAAAIVLRAVRDVAYHNQLRAEAIDFILSPECQDFLAAAGIRLDVTAEDILAASRKLYGKKPKHLAKKEHARPWA